MRKTKEILRLAQEAGLSNRQIARALSVSPTTVGECLRRAAEARLSYQSSIDMDEETLELRLYGEVQREPEKVMPDMRLIRKERARKGVTLALLWEEYREATIALLLLPVLRALRRLGW